MDTDKRVSATCPICREGELRRVDGPPEWYVLPAATLGLPDDEEKRVGRGRPVGISVCSESASRGGQVRVATPTR